MVFPMLHQIAYVSRSIEPLNTALLTNILEVSRRNNERDTITGVLMYHDGLFFQVIEGERAVVDLCYARILCDHRHQDLSLILNDTIETLTFSDWAMQYAGPDEIRGHTNSSLQSLADLRSGGEATTAAGNIGLALALTMFERRKGRFKTEPISNVPLAVPHAFVK
tara:strand:+ start:5363 stop:5860 length:498 start_codon:yes stop_codon:yes gene_type:complete